MDIYAALQSLLRAPEGGQQQNLTPETPLEIAARQQSQLRNAAATPGQFDPGLLVNNAPFQDKFRPPAKTMKADRPSWEKAFSTLSTGLKSLLDPTTSEGLPASGGPIAKPGVQVMERGGKKLANLLNAPSKTGKTVQTTVGENSKLTLNPQTGQARISDKKLADLSPAERLSLILQKSLSGVPLTAEDEKIWAARQSKKAPK